MVSPAHRSRTRYPVRRIYDSHCSQHPGRCTDDDGCRLAVRILVRIRGDQLRIHTWCHMCVPHQPQPAARRDAGPLRTPAAKTAALRRTQRSCRGPFAQTGSNHSLFLVNILLALSPIRLRTFWWASQLGMLPGTAVFVAAGASLPSLKTLESQGTAGVLNWQTLTAFLALGCLPISFRLLFNRKIGETTAHDQ